MAKLRMKDKDKEIRVKPMRYNPEDQKEFQSQIEELLDSKLIRPSHSPHSSPAFLVRKHAEIVRGGMTIAANASNYKIDSLQISALVNENYGKTDIPSCSSDEQMMDLISEKEEAIKVKETYSFRPQSDKTSSFETIIQNLIVQDPVELQILIMKELYSLPSTGIRFVDFKGVYPRINYVGSLTE
ncbi:hypothetical protein Tco_0516287 [Tanacetum coccineum]